MFNVSLRRRILLLAFVAVFASSLASAGPRISSPNRPAKKAAADVIRRFLGDIKFPWNEIGCNIDPNGGCISGPKAALRTIDQVRRSAI